MKLGSASNNTFFLRDSHDFADGSSTMVFPLAAVSRTTEIHPSTASDDIVCRPFSFGTIHPQQGLRFAHHLPVVCHSFGVLVTLSLQHRGDASLTPACGLVSPSGLLFSAERPIKSTILRAPQIDPEQTARTPSLALMIRSNFGLSLV